MHIWDIHPLDQEPFGDTYDRVIYFEKDEVAILQSAARARITARCQAGEKPFDFDYSIVNHNTSYSYSRFADDLTPGHYAELLRDHASSIQSKASAIDRTILASQLVIMLEADLFAAEIEREAIVYEAADDINEINVPGFLEGWAAPGGHS